MSIEPATLEAAERRFGILNDMYALAGDTTP